MRARRRVCSTVSTSWRLDKYCFVTRVNCTAKCIMYMLFTLFQNQIKQFVNFNKVLLFEINCFARLRAGMNNSKFYYFNKVLLFNFCL